MSEPARSTDVASDDLIEAATNLTHFAWTAVSADCEESRDYLNSLVDALRSALARIRAPITDAVAPVRWLYTEHHADRPSQTVTLDYEPKPLPYPGRSTITPLYAHPLPQGKAEMAAQATESMLWAGWHARGEIAGLSDIANIYAAMLKAAPRPLGEAGDTDELVERANPLLARRLLALKEHLKHQPLTHADSQDLETLSDAAEALTSLRAERDSYAQGCKDVGAIAQHTDKLLAAAESSLAAEKQRREDAEHDATRLHSEKMDAIDETIRIRAHWQERANAAEQRVVELTAERDDDQRTINEQWGSLMAISGALGSVRFMDPPDGGDVTVAEQVARMRDALAAAETQMRAKARVFANSCIQKLGDDEPFFVLLGRDKHAAQATRAWAEFRETARGASSKTTEAREIADAMDAYADRAALAKNVEG